jgi:hypothetical protein
MDAGSNCVEIADCGRRRLNPIFLHSETANAANGHTSVSQHAARWMNTAGSGKGIIGQVGDLPFRTCLLGPFGTDTAAHVVLNDSGATGRKAGS